MITIPEMIMIGGNTRNSGKTTMACSIISKLSATHEVIGLKVTSIRPGEEQLHGNHDGDLASGFSIFEEMDRESHKDTSKMLRAGASRVYYICVSDSDVEKAVLHFLPKVINKQVIVCESRSLREFIIPGLFLMMMRLPALGKQKEIDIFLEKADKIFYFDTDSNEKLKFAECLEFKNGKFVWIK